MEERLKEESHGASFDIKRSSSCLFYVMKVCEFKKFAKKNPLNFFQHRKKVGGHNFYSKDFKPKVDTKQRKRKIKRKRMRGCKKKKTCRASLVPREVQRDSFLQRRLQTGKSRKNNKRRRGRKGRIIAKETHRAFLDAERKLAGLFFAKKVGEWGILPKKTY